MCFCHEPVRMQQPSVDIVAMRSVEGWVMARRKVCLELRYCSCRHDWDISTVDFLASLMAGVTLSTHMSVPSLSVSPYSMCHGASSQVSGTSQSCHA